MRGYLQTFQEWQEVRKFSKNKKNETVLKYQMLFNSNRIKLDELIRRSKEFKSEKVFEYKSRNIIIKHEKNQ